jgi:hypothetical protein
MAKLSVRTEPAAPVAATFAAKAPPRAQPSFTVGTAAPVKKRRRGFGKAINAKGAGGFHAAARHARESGHADSAEP